MTGTVSDKKTLPIHFHGITQYFTMTIDLSEQSHQNIMYVHWCASPSAYTPYEGLNLANQRSRKLGVFGRKLKGSHFLFYCYFDKCILSFSLIFNIRENKRIMFKLCLFDCYDLSMFLGL